MVFGLYELIRILVPGFYFAALGLFFYWAYLLQLLPTVPSPFQYGLLFVFVALTAGLTLYAKESTKRRRAFQENQPSRYLSNKARTMNDLSLLDDDAARKLYFFILNNHVPSYFHEKIFFFGTVYHIMIQMRRTSLWYALLSLAIFIAEISRGTLAHELQGLTLFSIGVWIVYLLNVRYNKADRKMQENYQDQIFWLQLNDPLIEDILRKRPDDASSK